MITFEEHGSQVVLTYESDGFISTAWVDEKLKANDHVTLSRVFTVQKADLLSSEGDEDFGEDVRRFVIGIVNGDYRTMNCPARSCRRRSTSST